MQKFVYRKTKVKTLGKFLITFVNLLVFNYLLIYADKFQVVLDNFPVKANFIENKLAVDSSSTSVVLDNVIIDDSRHDGNITYVIKQGDSLESIASSVGTTVNNIRRVNNLSADADVRKDGTIVNKDNIALNKLTISELPGIVVAMDTQTSVVEFAKQYDLNIEDLKALNNISDSKTILKKGDELFITISESEAIKKGIIEDPNPPVILADKGDEPKSTPSKPSKPGEKPIQQKPVQQKPTNKPSTPTTPTKASAKARIVNTSSQSDIVGYNEGTIISSWFQKDGGYAGFAAGYCTSYAASRRPDIFANDDRAFRGNAGAWYSNAKAAGNKVGKTPAVGAIAVYSAGRGANGYGHVGIVEKVDSANGTIVLADMNYKGKYIVTKRVVDSDLAIGYIY